MLQLPKCMEKVLHIPAAFCVSEILQYLNTNLFTDDYNSFENSLTKSEVLMYTL